MQGAQKEYRVFVLVLKVGRIDTEKELWSTPLCGVLGTHRALFA